MGSGGNVGVLESFVIYSTSDQRRALYDGRRAHTLAVTQHEALRVGIVRGGFVSLPMGVRAAGGPPRRDGAPKTAEVLISTTPCFRTIDPPRS